MSTVLLVLAVTAAIMGPFCLAACKGIDYERKPPQPARPRGSEDDTLLPGELHVIRPEKCAPAWARKHLDGHATAEAWLTARMAAR